MRYIVIYEDGNTFKCDEIDSVLRDEFELGLCDIIDAVRMVSLLVDGSQEDIKDLPTYE